MRPSEWAKLVLDRHAISSTDGRPLYQYRITDSEFTSLTQLLKLSSVLGVSHIAKMPSWDLCFVIYGAEWWRRHYTGQWGWDGIFASIGIKSNDLSISQRNWLIETGLSRWKRDVRKNQNGKRQFLGTVATEGGLPLHQLAASGGWLAKVLIPVIKKHLSKGLSINVLLTSYQDLIPSSYRSAETELFGILEDIAESVVKLRQEYKLEDKLKPVDWLDENHSQWREIFPLPIDNDVAHSLLRELINTAAQEKKQPKQSFFDAEYHLVKIDTNHPELILKVNVPQFIFLDAIGMNWDENNTLASLEVEVGNGVSNFFYRGVRTFYQGKVAIKIFGKNIRIDGQDAIKALQVKFKSMGKTLHTLQISEGISLDEEIPLTFRMVDNQWIMVGGASHSVKDAEALVYLPKGYTFRLENKESSFELLGYLFEGMIFKLSGSLLCESGKDKFKIECNLSPAPRSRV